MNDPEVTVPDGVVGIGDVGHMATIKATGERGLIVKAQMQRLPFTRTLRFNDGRSETTYSSRDLEIGEFTGRLPRP